MVSTEYRLPGSGEHGVPVNGEYRVPSMIEVEENNTKIRARGAHGSKSYDRDIIQVFSSWRYN